MNASWKFAAVMLCAAGLSACGKSDDTANTTPPPPATPAAPAAPAMPNVDAAKDSMNNAAANAKDSMNNAAANTKDAAGNAMAGAKTGMGNLMSSGKSAFGDMQTQTGHTSVQADSAMKLGQANQAFNDKKYDVADALLKQVEANKSALPQNMQDGVTSLRTKLDAAMATK